MDPVTGAILIGSPARSLPRLLPIANGVKIQVSVDGVVCGRTAQVTLRYDSMKTKFYTSRFSNSPIELCH